MKRLVPIEAMRFSVGACQFAARTEDSKEDEGGEMYAVTITARSGQPVDHWYWGRVVHDLAGMTSKDRIPLDYCHDPEQIIGYADTPDASTGNLTLTGHLALSDERAREIVAKANSGVPYEASIFFDNPMTLEEVPENFIASVNGYQIEGPALIVRQWNLRGLAICPHGRDPRTGVEFSDEDWKTVDIKPTGEMKQPPAPADQTRAPADASAEADRQFSLADFTAAFGESGGVWFAEGKTFHEAARLFRDDVDRTVNDALAELKELKAARAIAEQQLTAAREQLAGRGELSAAPFNPEHELTPEQRRAADLAEKQKQYAGRLPPNLAALAASFRAK